MKPSELVGYITATAAALGFIRQIIVDIIQHKKQKNEAKNPVNINITINGDVKITVNGDDDEEQQ
jgi:hypothetical protein